MFQKKLFSLSLAGFLLFSGACGAAEKVFLLPDAETEGGMPLLEAMTARHSARAFSDKPVSAQVLSNLLYSAFGISHDGKHTIPTARGEANLKIYAVRADGAWLFNPKENTLTQVTQTDLRPLLAKQSYVMEAPLTLVFVGSDPINSPLHAGSSYQNVGLYAASVGLNAVVRGFFDKKSVGKELNLAPDEEAIISQTIGWPK